MEQLTYRRLLTILRRQWWVIAQAIIVVAAASGIYTQRMPLKPFQTTASFVVYPGAANPGTSVSVAGFYLTQEQLLRSDEVTDKAAARTTSGLSGAQVRSMLDINIDSTTGTIFITTHGAVSTQVVEAANAVVDEYIEELETTRLSSLEGRSKTINDQLADADARLQDLADKIAAAEALEQDSTRYEAQREVLVGQYQTLFDQQQTILTQLASQPQLTQRLSAPITAFRPANPSVALRTALGAALGLLVGCALAAAREVSNGRVQTRDELSASTDLPILAELPKVKRAKRSAASLLVVADPNGAYTEAVRSLATTIRFLSGGAGSVRVLTITSPQAGDGKSMIAANLAAEWALAGVRTILVSGDLRRPTVDEYFGHTGQPGLSDLLSADSGAESSNTDGDDRRESNPPEHRPVSTESMLCGSPVPMLSVLPAGLSRSNPAELLASSRFEQVVGDLRDLADMVIIDSPPAMVADAVILANAADGVLLVVCRDETQKRSLEAADQRLSTAGARALGIALNRSGSERSSYHGYYAPQPK